MTIFLLRIIKSFLVFISIFSFSYAAETTPQSAPPKRKLIKVLSIDGGGVVGIIPAMLLTEIEKKLTQKKNLAACFDLMAGTSTGGLIVLMLSTPWIDQKPRYTAADVLHTYLKLAPRIFEESFFRRVCTLNGWLDEKYSAENFEEILKEYVGDARLSQTLTQVLIPAYDINHNRTVFFTTDNARKEPISDFYLCDVARATSAAPTYFCPAQIQDICKKRNYTFVDGGIAIQNPALAALIEAVKIFGSNNDFLLVSLGGGANYGDPKGKIITSGGKLAWAGKIIPLFMTASEEVVTSQIQLLSAGDASRQYYRFQVVLPPEHAGLDNTTPENIEKLKTYGVELIRIHQKSLDKIASLLDGEDY